MVSKDRLDKELVRRGLIASRSQAESYIKLGQVKVNGRMVNKAGYLVSSEDKVELSQAQQYVSRAGLKLASVAEKLHLDFNNQIVLDVGSSTGGFTDYALKHGAQKVIAVDVGTEQLHPLLRGDERVELHEKTDIRGLTLPTSPGVVVIDVSFISLREILPAVAKLADNNTKIVAMVKPQFEAGPPARAARRQLNKPMNKGVIKNDKIRRQILKEFEDWSRTHWVIIDKADSGVAGAKGNLERFYLLKKAS